MLTVSRRLLQLQIKKLTPASSRAAGAFLLSMFMCLHVVTDQGTADRRSGSLWAVPETQTTQPDIQRPLQDFPGSPVVKAPCCQRQEYGFNPWLRN